MCGNVPGDSSSASCREASRLVFRADESERRHYLRLVVSLLRPDASGAIAGANVSTPCCFWAGKHRPRTVPVLIVDRGGTSGSVLVSVARYLWMLRYRRIPTQNTCIYHMCGNRRCIAPDHLFASPSAAVLVGRMKSAGVLHACVHDGVLYRVWHESGDHGRIVDMPEEWGYEYPEDSRPEPRFDLVAWLSEMLGESESDVVRMTSASERRYALSYVARRRFVHDWRVSKMYRYLSEETGVVDDGTETLGEGAMSDV